MSTKTTALKPGDIIHWLRSGLIFRISESEHATSEVSKRGSELVITEAILAAGRDRNSENSPWDLADDQDGQRARWGSQGYARGSRPAGLTNYTPGTTEEEVEYGARHTAAWAVSDPASRAEALAALKAEFGSPVTSTTIRTERGTY